MKIFPFQAWYPDFDLIASSDSFFGSVRDEYVTYKETGFFNQSKKDALFFYKIKSTTRSYVGLMCCTDVAEYENGNILKHEKTLAEKEQKMIQLLMQRKALVKPVLLAYPKVNPINKLITRYIEEKKPFYSTFFDQDKQEHFIWKVTDDKTLKKVAQLFDKHVETTYIADGHHRTTTMVLLNERLKNKPNTGNYDQLMVVLFGSDQLDVFEYNRVIEGLNERSPAHFMARISQLFDIELLEKATKPTKKHQLSLFMNREWYLLTWKAEVLKEYESEKIILDVKLLNEKVLGGILGIKDVRFDQRIEYVSGTKGLRGLEKATVKSENRIGFYLYPVQLSELMSLADVHELLPPKSTWFEPRIKNGLVVKSLEK